MKAGRRRAKPGRLGSVVLDAGRISRRVRALGAEIGQYYRDGDLLVVGLLKGSFMFLGDLVRHIPRPHQVDFIVASSYGRGTRSSGRLRLVYEPATSLRGKHILLVEDIVESGNTLNRLVRLLRRRRPRSLEVCALLHKHQAAALEIKPRFVGFAAPSEFLVGYGLDHAEDFRHLPYIASVEV
jgi:hypoxanthine phosphoribosyltransferase